MVLSQLSHNGTHMCSLIGCLGDVSLRVSEHLVHLFDLLKQVTMAP